MDDRQALNHLITTVRPWLDPRAFSEELRVVPNVTLVTVETAQITEDVALGRPARKKESPERREFREPPRAKEMESHQGGVIDVPKEP